MNDTKYTQAKNIVEYGLNKLPTDLRDFQFGSLFGDDKDPSVLPDEFFAGEILGVKDQKNTDYCSAFAGTGVSELQEHVELDPLFTMMATKIEEGRTDTWGANLRDSAKSQVDYGSLKKIDSTHTIDEERSTILDKNNWSKEQFKKAEEHKKESFLFINPYGKIDLFDAIRFAIYDGRIKSQAVQTGALWRYSWNSARDGIIPKVYEDGGSGHSFYFLGWQKLDGELYMIAILSNGSEIGDAGMYYFPREVIDRECVYGNIIFYDKSAEEVKLDLGFMHVIKELIQYVVKFFQNIIKLFSK